ncbi:unnamed protein product [Cyprideis torosa]|uniref:Uncharacterized protein n=1 Tax=Cyprideis torosa TaxID=163714 RepID=A0A7R8ZPV4_9CRUS|nr:unnamed protein product [Cyprideis torosa]CAG0890713.1 unnamed protein product [Cyprideis torosa]
MSREAGQTSREAGQTSREAGQTSREAGQTSREAGQTSREAGQTSREAGNWQMDSQIIGSEIVGTKVLGTLWLEKPDLGRFDPLRFADDGVSFKGKLIGVLEVPDARGEKMCQEAMGELKMAIKAAGEHKRKIHICVALDGIRLKDEGTRDCLYHHPVHRISFIAQDGSDSRAFGYVSGSPDLGHRYFGIKTDKAAQQASLLEKRPRYPALLGKGGRRSSRGFGCSNNSNIVQTIRDLFEVVYSLRKQNLAEDKANRRSSTDATSTSASHASANASTTSKWASDKGESKNKNRTTPTNPAAASAPVLGTAVNEEVPSAPVATPPQPPPSSFIPVARKNSYSPPPPSYPPPPLPQAIVSRSNSSASSAPALSNGVGHQHFGTPSSARSTGARPSSASSSWRTPPSVPVREDPFGDSFVPFGSTPPAAGIIQPPPQVTHRRRTTSGSSNTTNSSVGSTGPSPRTGGGATYTTPLGNTSTEAPSSHSHSGTPPVRNQSDRYAPLAGISILEDLDPLKPQDSSSSVFSSPLQPETQSHQKGPGPHSTSAPVIGFTASKSPSQTQQSVSASALRPGLKKEDILSLYSKPRPPPLAELIKQSEEDAPNPPQLPQFTPPSAFENQGYRYGRVPDSNEAQDLPEPSTEPAQRVGVSPSTAALLPPRVEAGGTDSDFDGSWAAAAPSSLTSTSSGHSSPTTATPVAPRKKEGGNSRWQATFSPDNPPPRPSVAKPPLRKMVTAPSEGAAPQPPELLPSFPEPPPIPEPVRKSTVSLSGASASSRSSSPSESLPSESKSINTPLSQGPQAAPLKRPQAAPVKVRNIPLSQRPQAAPLKDLFSPAEGGDDSTWRDADDLTLGGEDDTLKDTEAKDSDDAGEDLKADEESLTMSAPPLPPDDVRSAADGGSAKGKSGMDSPEYHSAKDASKVTNGDSVASGKGSDEFHSVASGKGSDEFHSVASGKSSDDFHSVASGRGSDNFHSVASGKGSDEFHSAAFGKGSDDFHSVASGKGSDDFQSASSGDKPVSSSEGRECHSGGERRRRRPGARDVPPGSPWHSRSSAEEEFHSAGGEIVVLKKKPPGSPALAKSKDVASSPVRFGKAKQEPVAPPDGFDDDFFDAAETPALVEEAIQTEEPSEEEDKEEEPPEDPFREDTVGYDPFSNPRSPGAWDTGDPFSMVDPFNSPWSGKSQSSKTHRDPFAPATPPRAEIKIPKATARQHKKNASQSRRSRNPSNASSTNSDPFQSSGGPDSGSDNENARHGPPTSHPVPGEWPYPYPPPPASQYWVYPFGHPPAPYWGMPPPPGYATYRPKRGGRSSSALARHSSSGGGGKGGRSSSGDNASSEDEARQDKEATPVAHTYFSDDEFTGNNPQLPHRSHFPHHIPHAPWGIMPPPQPQDMPLNYSPYWLVHVPPHAPPPSTETTPPHSRRRRVEVAADSTPLFQATFPEDNPGDNHETLFKTSAVVVAETNDVDPFADDDFFKDPESFEDNSASADSEQQKLTPGKMEDSWTKPFDAFDFGKVD